MRKIIFFLLTAVSLIFPENVSFRIRVKNKEVAKIVGIADVKILTEKKNFKIEIYDKNGKKCKIAGVNREEGIIDIFFRTDTSETYSLTLEEGNVYYPEFKNGKIIIDDFLPPDSTKAGFWNWIKKSISGIYSHKDREGFSFHRVSFPDEFLIKGNNKLVCFLYIDKEKSPDEILVEVGTRYRRSYFFSFGKDTLNWKGLKKINLGPLPEKNKWVKIEIPFSYLKENSLKAIGFYHNKGNILWDRISIDAVAAECEVINCVKEKSSATAYFNYEIEGPFEHKDKKFFSLKLDASPSLCESLLWDIDGKIYKNKKIRISFNELKNPVVKLNVEKDGEKDKIKHLFNISNIPVEKINLTVKIYPFSNFIEEGEKLLFPFRVENLSDIPLYLDILFNKWMEKIYLLPGKENGRNFTFPIEGNKNIYRFSIFTSNVKIDEKKIRIINPYENFILSGPFLKNDEGDYLVLRVKDFENKKEKLPDNFDVIFIGDYPETFKRILEEKLCKKITGIKEEKYYYKNRLISEIKFIKENSKKIKNNDVVFFIPSFEAILRSFPVEWEKGMKIIISLIRERSKYIYFIFPYITPDKNLLFFEKRIKKMCEEKQINFVDFSEIFGKDWVRYYSISDRIFKPLPDEKGYKIASEELLNYLK